MYSGEEGDLIDPEVPETGDDPLIEQGRDQRALRSGSQSARRLGGIPIGPQRVWAEVGESSPHRRGGPEFHDGHVDPPERPPIIQRRADPDRGHPPRGQGTSGCGDRPGTLHQQMSVQRPSRIQVRDQVLSVRLEAGDRQPRQRRARSRPRAELSGDDPATSDLSVQAGGEPVDAVTFGHDGCPARFDDSPRQSARLLDARPLFVNCSRWAAPVAIMRS